jgi:hypothetical protein
VRDIPGVEVAVSVRLSLTADQWDLYQLDGVEQVAQQMNIDVAHALNRGDLKAADEVLVRNAKYGAADMQPRRVLLSIIARMGLQW